MQVVMEKLGDSRVISIPDTFLQQLQLTGDDPVYISLENDCIVISKEKRMTLKERLIEFYGEDYEEKCRKDCDDFYREHGVIEWGPPVGHEIW